MAKDKREWRDTVIPFEWYRAATKGGALVFQIEDGKYKDYQFVRPSVTVRRSFDKGNPGFKLGYTVNQTFDANGDVEFEDVETVNIRKSRKGADGKYVTEDEQEVFMTELGS